MAWRRHDWRCCPWGGVPRPQTNLALRPKHVPAQAVAEVHHILVVGSKGSTGRQQLVVAIQHPNQLNPIHVGWHRITMEYTVAWLNDSSLRQHRPTLRSRSA